MSDIVLPSTAPTAILISEHPFGDDLPEIHALVANRGRAGNNQLVSELRRRMMQHYKTTLQGTTWTHSAVGTGKFDSGGKIRSTSANPVKIALVQELKAILETAAFIETRPPSDEDQRHRRQLVNVKGWHWLENQVIIGDRRYAVGLSIRDDNTGLFHYNINPI